jgi:hypothetical protein
VPVLKKKGSAQAGVASHTPAATVAATNRYFEIETADDFILIETTSIAQA